MNKPFCSDQLPFNTTHRVRPWFNCPWTGTECPDRVGCVKNDECWGWKMDKLSSFSEQELKEYRLKNCIEFIKKYG